LHSCISAIGETANACSRLEGLTKQYDCRVIVSRRAAETAGLDVRSYELHRASVNGLAQSVEFYTLKTPADVRV
jgi:adenylate cyclase